MSRLKTTLAAALFALTPMAVQAQDTLNILVDNFDIEFDGTTGQIYDLNRPLGGNLAAGESRTVSAIEYEFNGVSTLMQTNPPDALFADLLLTNLGPDLTTDALINDGGAGDPNAFGFDLFTAGGDSLQLGIDDISYVVVDTSVPGADIFQWFAEATVVSQNMPNGYIYGDTVLISYTATDADLTVGPNGVSALTASGQLTITGTAVPEPSSLALIALGGVAMLRRRRRA